ncbi:MAG TPA: metallophosphoesterase [Labilithrix sp.]|nr:metallophosphoesterase [Labilithrix sp.]
MRVIVLLLISGAAHLLAARWVLSVWPRARAHHRQVYAVAGGLALVLSTLRLLGWWFGGPFFHDVFAVAMVELAVVLIALLPLGVVALATRATARAFDAIRPVASDTAKQERISRREALERAVGLSVVSATTVGLGWGIVRGRHAFALDEVVVRVNGWPRALDGYVIAQVSDIHVGMFVRERELAEGFDLVRKIRPDLVVATGDLVDADAEQIPLLLRELMRVDARDGACAVLGNHDHYAGARRVAARIRVSEVRLLDNEGVHLRPNDGGGFALLGVDDLVGRRQREPGYSGPDLRRALAGLSPDLPRILLAHQPNYFLESQGRVALQLSGHTHGGQINPGFRPAATFMEFIAGRYERADSTLYVNRGFGVTGPPARIAAPPEVTKIVIASR